MTLLTYTPYDGSAKPFTIGLMPLDPARWIEPDADLGRYLDEKQRLLYDRRNDVFVSEAGSEHAQRECLDLLTTYLCEQHPAIYRRDGDTISAAGHSIDLADPSLPPLLKAGSLVADDLVIMRRKENGWHLVAGHVAFPSSWSLQEKFGRPMQAIHGDVPGFGEGTRNAVLITRIFDNLQVAQPVERMNWSVSTTKELSLRTSKHSRPPAATPPTLETRFARVERQTLRKLPVSGDILFTIRVYVDPIAAIANHPKASELALSFAAQLDALDEQQTAYKGLTHQKSELARQLRALADVASPA
ncbi:heme-dependent oxidative N-demethylase family protein [Rhizobium sp. LEGMi198b]